MTLEEKKQNALKMKQGGISLEEIGESLGVNKSTVSRWVNELEAEALQELEDRLQQAQDLLQSERNEMQQELDSLQTERNEMQQHLDAMQQKLDSLQVERNKMQQAIESLQAERNNMQQSESALQALRKELQQAHEALQQAEEEKSVMSMQLGQLDSEAISAAERIEEMQKDLDRIATQMEQSTRQKSALQDQVKSLRDKEADRRRNWFVLLFKGDFFMTAVILLGGISFACAITAPIFMHVGVTEGFAYALALYVDIAAFVFVLRNRHRLGVMFSIAVGVQAVIKLGGLDWMGGDALTISKAFVLALALALATYGFSDLVASSQAEKE